MAEFNINEYVRVKLNDHGRKILEDDYNALMGGEYRQRFPYKPRIEDADGWSKFQLWELMRNFGPHITLGRSPPFETVIDIPSLNPAGK